MVERILGRNTGFGRFCGIFVKFWRILGIKNAPSLSDGAWRAKGPTVQLEADRIHHKAD